MLSPEIFKSYDVRGLVGGNITAEVMELIARAYADFLPTSGTVAVGRDVRPSSAELALAFIEGLVGQGRDVIDIGVVSSDMLAYAVGKNALAGGAMITAGHSPTDVNGVKLYRDNVTPVGLVSGLSSIRDAVLEKRFKPESQTPGSITRRDLNEFWVQHCLGFARGLQPLHVAIDAGHGMAGLVLPQILARLPLKVTELNFEPHETVRREAGTHSSVVSSVARTVIDNALDFGVAFDFDADSVIFVDDKGRQVVGSDLLTLIVQPYLKKFGGAKIVHDVRTSRSTQDLIKQWGGEPVKAKVGRNNITARMRDVKAPLGGETTGHYYFTENYDADSGIIAMLVAVQAISDSHRRLSELVDEYRTYVMEPERDLSASDPQSALLALAKAFEDGQQDNLDGLSVGYPNSWFNVRASNTEPILRLNAEARTQHELDALIEKIKGIVQTQN